MRCRFCKEKVEDLKTWGFKSDPWDSLKNHVAACHKAQYLKIQKYVQQKRPVPVEA